MDNSSAAKSARYRAKDVEAYRKRKRELTKEPKHKRVRAQYARKWRKENKEHANELAAESRARKRIKLGLPPPRIPMTPEEAKEKKRLARAKWRNENREKFNERSRLHYHKYKHRYKEKIRGYKLKKKYGISVEEYNRIFAEQGMMCAICDHTVPGNVRGWHLDHCHKSGKVRGILCHVCNTKLGWYEAFKFKIESYLGRSLASWAKRN